MKPHSADAATLRKPPPPAVPAELAAVVEALAEVLVEALLRDELGQGQEDDDDARRAA